MSSRQNLVRKAPEASPVKASEGRFTPEFDAVQREVDLLARTFFSRPHWEPAVDLEWDLEPRAMPPGSRAAMVATFAMLAVGLLGIGTYTIYHKVLMPTPVALGAQAGPPLELPMPRLEASQALFEQVAMVPPEEMERRAAESGR